VHVHFTGTDDQGRGDHQGPGDLAAANLEGVFVFDGGDNQGWTISNLEIFDFDLSIGMFNGAGGSDAFWSQGYKWALRTAEMLADYDVTWFEEPLRPDAMNDYVELRRRAPVPIAGGEVFTRRQSFQPWLQAGAFDVVQPDVTKVGGISEERRIAWMAQENGVRFIPHGWNTAIGLAADLQLASAFPDTDMVEYLTGSPFIDEIALGGWHLDAEGMLPIPTLPGLGLKLDPDTLAKYTGGARLVD